MESLKNLWMAMPRPRPAGSGVPQPASAAARFSTARCRGESASSSRRRSTGSRPATRAISSRKVSLAKQVCEAYTERHQPTGTGVCTGQ